jgi:hypothetical protein
MTTRVLLLLVLIAITPTIALASQEPTLFDWMASLVCPSTKIIQVVVRPLENLCRTSLQPQTFDPRPHSNFWNEEVWRHSEDLQQELSKTQKEKEEIAENAKFELLRMEAVLVSKSRGNNWLRERLFEEKGKVHELRQKLRALERENENLKKEASRDKAELESLRFRSFDLEQQLKSIKLGVLELYKKLEAASSSLSEMTESLATSEASRWMWISTCIALVLISLLSTWIIRQMEERRREQRQRARAQRKIHEIFEKLAEKYSNTSRPLSEEEQNTVNAGMPSVEEVFNNEEHSTTTSFLQLKWFKEGPLGAGVGNLEGDDDEIKAKLPQDEDLNAQPDEKGKKNVDLKSLFSFLH